jgi:hypothetical protein
LAYRFVASYDHFGKSIGRFGQPPTKSAGRFCAQLDANQRSVTLSALNRLFPGFRLHGCFRRRNFSQRGDGLSLGVPLHRLD